MSAAEKLERLERTIRGRMITAGRVYGLEPESLAGIHTSQLRNTVLAALPEIIAVVKAAEKARAADWQPHGKSYWELEQLLNEIRDPADAALSALDEKLNGAA